MAKTTYSRAKLEKTMSHKYAQDFMNAQANAKLSDKSFSGRVVRVFSVEGERKVLESVTVRH